MFKLGTIVSDSVTGLTGMLTHLGVEGESRIYLFQPRGLNPKTQEPVSELWIAPDRVVDGIEVPVTPQLAEALQVLGTEVEDHASGFKGIAVAAVLHISGCVHLAVQPPGVLPETGTAIRRQDFDIRRLKGEAIKVMSEAERERDQVERPSPKPFPPIR